MVAITNTKPFLTFPVRVKKHFDAVFSSFFILPCDVTTPRLSCLPHSPGRVQKVRLVGLPGPRRRQGLCKCLLTREDILPSSLS